MRYFFFLVLLFSSVIYSWSQEVPQNGVKESTPSYIALKNATIYLTPEKKISHGTILIKDNKIEGVGLMVIVPAEAVVIDCSDKIIMPAFIDLYSNVGLPEVKASESRSRTPQLNSSKKGAYYWNEAIHPEVSAAELYASDPKAMKDLLAKGFGFALVHQQDGIARGSAAFVSLGTEDVNLTHLTNNSFFSFSKGVSRQSYPSSQMGSIALLRQAFYDAEYYSGHKDEINLSLEALLEQKSHHLYFSTQDKYEILRAKKIAGEFGLKFKFIGSGNEYEIAHLLKNEKLEIVLPLTYPKAYDVKDPYIARQIPLSDLKHWEMAPQNASILSRNGACIAFTSNGTKNADEFWDNLRKTISNGLSEEDALKALTLGPAKMLGVDKEVGTLEKGKIASFMIYDKNPFEEKSQLLESWIQGTRTILKTMPLHDVRGKYTLNVDRHKLDLDISGTTEKLKAKITYSYASADGTSKDSTITAHIALDDNDINLQFILDAKDLKGNVSLKGKVNTKLGIFEGEGLIPNGEWIKWTAVKNGKAKDKNDKKPSRPRADTLNRTWMPNMAYGFEKIPDSGAIVIRNATLWTNEEDGILKDASLTINNGKIVYVGTGSPPVPAGAKVIDAKGKHVTSGIIDEHSHIAISRGVNEGGQAISAEVSIGDVVNPDDINIYRQLSGGVTAAQLLHGSANPVGGQSALIKLKWGHSPDDMLIDNAPKFIKFALGENVKQSNWGDFNTVRFPQTRMGVEQVYYDGFLRAKAYDELWRAYRKDTTKPKPYRDLELDVLSEILRSERFISCHSYIQSEINMLMHVADSMGFRVNTFTHILEGYKVADKMAEHGVGGSTFSDWWAYKYEVSDAIPYNAKIMHDQGVVVAINSDDAEMGRRLNQEAAKAIKYGGMSQEDAWKMVTLNPAKLLHLDDRMGSLKAGKDADVVIWTHNPLSINAKVQYTIVDGQVMFDYEADREKRIANQAEKARIITKMLDDNENGGETKPFFKRKQGSYHCNTLGEEMSTEENEH